jgi:hypothetical protein
MANTRVEKFDGYCKVRNETRQMSFTYEDDDGVLSLIKGECDFDKCRYAGECYIIKTAFAREDN